MDSENLQITCKNCGETKHHSECSITFQTCGDCMRKTKGPGLSREERIELKRMLSRVQSPRVFPSPVVHGDESCIRYILEQ